MPGPRRRTNSASATVAVGITLLIGCGSLGCGRSSGKPEPDAKVRLTKVQRLYQKYVEKNRKGPPDEQALHDFGQKLTAKERDEYLIGDDLESIWTSPRDNQQYEIHYGLGPFRGPMRAIAWEATGKDGRRYVALTNGYVEEYDEATFQKYRK
jgi:hypothetical protein